MGIAVPLVFVALMASEYVYNAVRNNGYQTPRDSAVSVMLQFPHAVLVTVVPAAWFFAYRAIEARIPWQLPDTWWTWPLGIVVMDFAAYWMHRYHHAINLTWGVHSVHHSSDEFTITTGGRSSLAEPLVNVLSGAYVILIIPVFVGLPASAAAFGWLVKECWGTAVHTRNVKKLGVLEHILATPSHHRVHHANNAVYTNKNFGFGFIFWDKLFGTFQPELSSVPPTFGTHNAPASFQPLAVAFHELRTIWRWASRTRRWRDKLRIWFMPTGWRPADVIEPAPIHARYEPPAPSGLYVVGGLQLVYLLVCLTHLALTMQTSSLGANLAFLGFLVLGTVVTGEFFECRRSFVTAECTRGAIAGLSLVATGGWFGRPIGGFAIASIALGTLNVVLAVAYTRVFRARQGQKAVDHARPSRFSCHGVLPQRTPRKYPRIDGM